MTNTIILNQETMSSIYAFAKTNKVNSNKVVDLILSIGQYNATSVSAEAQEIINSFAKEHKVSKTKITDLAAQVALASGKAVVSAKARVGRSANGSTIELRQKIVECSSEIKNVSIKDVASKFGADEVVVRTTIKFLENNGFITRTGLKDKEPGVRGKKEILYSAV